jgi:DNA repair/transcription protein MET18/MMS19
VVAEACNKELQDPEAKMAHPAGKVLASCASVSTAANGFIVERTLPLLIKLFRESESVNKRTAILGILNGFLDASATVYNGADLESVPLMAVKDDLFDVYSKGFLGSSSVEKTYKLTALDGFRRLLSMKGILLNNEIGIVVQYFNDVVLNDENEDTWFVPVLVNI